MQLLKKHVISHLFNTFAFIFIQLSNSSAKFFKMSRRKEKGLNGLDYGQKNSLQLVVCFKQTMQLSIFCNQTDKLQFTLANINIYRVFSIHQTWTPMWTPETGLLEKTGTKYKNLESRSKWSPDIRPLNYVTCMLTCSRTSMPCLLTCSRANMSQCLRAHVPMCLVC